MLTKIVIQFLKITLSLTILGWSMEKILQGAMALLEAMVQAFR